jgi:23S rRNA pseudouridine1911/1915/1917 synthase
VVDKPAGMECERRHEQRNWSKQKRQRQQTLVEALADKGCQVLPVHRLDRDTSGLMVYARTPAAQQALIAQFATHSIGRRYRAVAIGSVQAQTVRSWLVRDRGDQVRGSSAQATPGAEEAVTHVAVVEYLLDGKYTLLDCRLETGRTHQIRIHLAEMGHPICGEKIYLRPAPGAEPVVDSSEAPRQALHAYLLEFVHPEMGRPLRFEAPWPDDLKRWLETLAKP